MVRLLFKSLCCVTARNLLMLRSENSSASADAILSTLYMGLGQCHVQVFS